MTAGDYTHFKFTHRNKTRSRHVLATDTSTELADFITPRSAEHTIYIQRISFAPTTYATQNFLFRDGAGTPVPIGQITVPGAALTTGVNQWVIDYGPEGTPLTKGEELDVIVSAAGLAGRLVVEAYEVGPQVQAMGPSN
jgi:hypothetical protein